MKKTVISLAAVAILTPMILQAGGVGVYIPYSIGQKTSSTYYAENELVTPNRTYDTNLKDKPGIGFAFATNLGKESMTGYKLGLEYTNPEGEFDPSSGSMINILNTLEFGVYSNDFVRLWIGPRINVGYAWYDNNGYSEGGVELGIAPATGVNVNLAGNVSITFDIDYKFAWQGGSVSGSRYSSYTSSPTGMTARLGVMYRFGEEDEY